MITGFRVGRGGAQGLFGVRPDLSCFGKVIGGGLNVGAFGGRADVMDHLAPLGPVYQAGTLSGNPLATAAGLAALDLLDDGAYELLGDRATALAAGPPGRLRRRRARRPHLRRSPGSSACTSATTCPVDYADARATDEAVYAAFFHALLARGVALAPGAYEVAFPGLAHDDAVIDAIVEAAGEAAADVVAAAAGVGTTAPG